jgi:hypothetical protein
VGLDVAVTQSLVKRSASTQGVASPVEAYAQNSEEVKGSAQRELAGSLLQRLQRVNAPRLPGRIFRHKLLGFITDVAREVNRTRRQRSADDDFRERLIIAGVEPRNLNPNSSAPPLRPLSAMARVPSGVRWARGYHQRSCEPQAAAPRIAAAHQITQVIR